METVGVAVELCTQKNPRPSRGDDDDDDDDGDDKRKKKKKTKEKERNVLERRDWREASLGPPISGRRRVRRKRERAVTVHFFFV